MPVYELAENMTYEEFQGWIYYLERRPAGWQEDNRAFKLMQVQGFKGQPSSVFPSLDAISRSGAAANPDGTVNVANLKQSALFSKMLSAKGGERIDFSEG